MRRLSGCTDLGRRLYFLTFHTKERRRFLTVDIVTPTCKLQILRAATVTDFSICAYSYMPDPAHLLVRGQAAGSDLRKFVKRARQLSSFHAKQLTGRRLWAPGYYDRVVRHDEDAQRYVRYILLNPVRGGLTSAIGIHPHTSASTGQC